MNQVHFRFSTDILRRLGEELNPSPAQGIIELVKNSYDADATQCVIELSTSSQESSFSISDDGVGMDRQAIENGWLMLGRSSKTENKETSKFKRLPAGNKGLGRLAALRMGTKALLVTRPDSEPDNEYRLELNWAKFDKHEVVEEVPLALEKVKRTKEKDNGTRIVVSGLRQAVNRQDVKQIARELLLLADPFADNPSGFNPVLHAPDFTDLEQLVRMRYFDDAELHLQATIDSNGNASAKVLDWKGQIIFHADHRELRYKSKNVPFNCPQIKFDLWVFILNTNSFSSKYSTLSEVRNWLKEFGGVHLYVRGIRVAPYGNSGHDWLEMNLSRVRDPELRPATSTSLGRIVVEDRHSRLLEKTDRSGLVESEAFNEIKGFAISAMDWMARCRLKDREVRRRHERENSKKKSHNSKRDVAAAIEKLPPATRESIKSTFKAYDHKRDKEVKALQNEVQLYRTLGTVGINAAVFAHESRHPIEIITRDMRTIERNSRNSEAVIAEAIAAPLTRIKKQVAILSAYGDLTLHLVSKDKRRTARIDVHKCVERIIQLFSAYTDTRDVEMRLEFEEARPYIMGSEAALESIISNLLTNSLKAFAITSPRKRTILIRTELMLATLVLRFMDNGPGIQVLPLNEIWLPGETRFNSGTGLGLTIVRDSVSDLGGSVEAKAKGELGGAEFLIELPIIGD